MVPEEKTNSSSKISIHDMKNAIKKKKKNKTMADHQEKPNGVATKKPRIKEMAPICKSRKKYERSKREEDDDDEGFVWLFSQANQQESLWLSSESLSPLYKGGDYSVDERLISFLSSYRGIRIFDGSNADPVKQNLVEDSKDEDAESWLLDPLESTIGSSSWLDSSSNHESSSTALSKCSDSSSLFWDLDRTGMWVSLINLEGEDCKWISNVGLDSEDLESNFPSPTYESKRSFDVHFPDVDVSSSMNSLHDELSSELLSGSLDLDDMEFDEPLMWPFDDSSYTSYVFCQSPRRGLGSSSALLKSDGRKLHSKEWWNRRFVAASKFVGFKRGSRGIVIASRNTKPNRSSRNSMKMMLSASKLGKKSGFRKGNLVMPAKRLEAMSLVGIDELNWWQSHSSSSSMGFDGAGLWVSLINLNGEDSEWISELETDCVSPKNRRNQVFWSSEILTCDKDRNWSMAWDGFCVSPRRGLLGKAAQRDGHRGFGNPGSIGVRIHEQRAGFKRGLVGVSGLSASGFKRGYGKKGNARRAKAMNSRIGRSVARKLGEKMEVIMESDVGVEKMIGLEEFDGHQGLDMEFHTESFSILEE